MKKPNKMMRGGMANAASRAPAQAGAGLARAAEMMRGGKANAASRVPAQAGGGMAQAAGRGIASSARSGKGGAGRPSTMPSQAGAGLARAAEMSGRAVWPRGMKKGGKVDGVAKKGKTKGRKC